MNLGFRAVEGAVDEAQFSKVSTQSSTKQKPIHRVRQRGSEFPQIIQIKHPCQDRGFVNMAQGVNAKSAACTSAKSASGDPGMGPQIRPAGPIQDLAGGFFVANPV